MNLHRLFFLLWFIPTYLIGTAVLGMLLHALIKKWEDWMHVVRQRRLICPNCSTKGTMDCCGGMLQFAPRFLLFRCKNCGSRYVNRIWLRWNIYQGGAKWLEPVVGEEYARHYEVYDKECLLRASDDCAGQDVLLRATKDRMEINPVELLRAEPCEG